MKIRAKKFSFTTYESSCGSSYKEFILLNGKVFSREYRSWENWHFPFEEDPNNEWNLTLEYGSNHEEPVDYRVKRVKNGFISDIDPFVEYDWVEVDANKIKLF